MSENGNAQMRQWDNEWSKDGDDRLFVQFHDGAVPNEKASQEKGRPIFDTVEFIRIGNPGDPHTITDRPIKVADTLRFQKQYRAWKMGRDQELVSGTPLTVLTQTVPQILTVGQVEEFKHFNIFTAEQLANLPDEFGQKFMGFHKMRAAAKTFIDAASSKAPQEHLRAELEKRDNELEVIRRQMAELQAQLTEQAAANPKHQGKKA